MLLIREEISSLLSCLQCWCTTGWLLSRPRKVMWSMRCMWTFQSTLWLSRSRPLTTMLGRRMTARFDLGVGLGSVDLVAGDNVFEGGGTAGQDRIVLACKGRLEEQEQDKLD